MKLSGSERLHRFGMLRALSGGGFTIAAAGRKVIAARLRGVP